MIRRRLEALIAFFQGLLEHAAVEGQLGDEELEPADFGFEFGYAELFTRYRVLLEGFPAVVGRGPDAGLAAGVVDIQAGIEVGLEVAEDRRDLVRPGSFSHGSLPGSLPVVRFPLWLDQDLGAGQGVEFQLEYLPAYSPNLNLIERLWRFLRKEALQRW